MINKVLVLHIHGHIHSVIIMPNKKLPLFLLWQELQDLLSGRKRSHTLATVQHQIHSLNVLSNKKLLVSIYRKLTMSCTCLRQISFLLLKAQSSQNICTKGMWLTICQRSPSSFWYFSWNNGEPLIHKVERELGRPSSGKLSRLGQL